MKIIFYHSSPRYTAITALEIYVQTDEFAARIQPSRRSASGHTGAGNVDFRIEFILKKHFSLVGDRDDEPRNIGADIKYRFEFQ